MQSANASGTILVAKENERAGVIVGGPYGKRSLAASRHVIVLVHGIRTSADWFIEIRDVLTREGFKVELTNYGRFDLFRFLLPISLFRTWAVSDIERDIRTALARHNVDRVSVIAHSFGTYCIAQILRRRFDIKFRHIIFCGSVVNFRFPFQDYASRYEGTLLNEVGTHDFWPILAESATWGYGSAGAFGFKRPGIFDRYHRGVSHSAFLNAAFCEKYWVPVLKGAKPPSADLPQKPPFWLQVLYILQIKYILIILLTLLIAVIWCRAPEEEVSIQQDDIYFAGGIVSRLVAEAEQPCNHWCPECMQNRRCMTTTETQSAAENLVMCQVHKTYFTYSDPAFALQKLQSDVIPCLQVDGVEDRRLRIRVNSLAVESKTTEGRSLWLCGCDASGREKVRRATDHGE